MGRKRVMVQAGIVPENIRAEFFSVLDIEQRGIVLAYADDTSCTGERHTFPDSRMQSAYDAVMGYLLERVTKQTESNEKKRNSALKRKVQYTAPKAKEKKINDVEVEQKIEAIESGEAEKERKEKLKEAEKERREKLKKEREEERAVSERIKQIIKETSGRVIVERTGADFLTEFSILFDEMKRTAFRLIRQDKEVIGGYVREQAFAKMDETIEEIKENYMNTVQCSAPTKERGSNIYNNIESADFHNNSSKSKTEYEIFTIPSLSCANKNNIDYLTELKGKNIWVNWKMEWNSQQTRKTKPPYTPQDIERRAETDNAFTWANYECAVGNVADGSADGVGLVINRQYTGDLIGIDLDDCVHVADDGKVFCRPEAKEIIEHLATYCELSPSKTGLHLFVRGAVPEDIGCKFNMPDGWRMEIYRDNHYFTVTEQPVEGCCHIAKNQDGIEWLIKRFNLQKNCDAKKEKPHAQPRRAIANRSDSEILQRAFNCRDGEIIKRLYSGDISVCNDNWSDADYKLCGYLLYFCNKDVIQADRLFRGSALYRSKWDERHFRNGMTYGEHTLQTALSYATY